MILDLEQGGRDGQGRHREQKGGFFCFLRNSICKGLLHFIRSIWAAAFSDFLSARWGLYCSCSWSLWCCMWVGWARRNSPRSCSLRGRTATVPLLQTLGHGGQKGNSCSSISFLADLTDRGRVRTTRGLTACSGQWMVCKLGVSRSHCAFLMYTATRCCLCRACRAVKGTELWEQKEWKITEHFHLQIYCVLLSRSLNACANEQRGHNMCIRMK